MTTQVEEMLPTHWDAVRAIYQEGIATGQATFETGAPPWEEWDGRHLPHSRLIAKDADTILGWAALSPVSKRQVYSGVAEVSVYVGAEARGKGVGRALLESLIQISEQNGIWTLQAGIFPENEASIGLHLKCGFRLVGKRVRIGRLGGEWRDTVLLEKRSTKV
jgi:phosphinothricin acetyltransferase